MGLVTPQGWQEPATRGARRVNDTSTAGKWHAGHNSVVQTPKGRGFDTSLGYFNGTISSRTVLALMARWQGLAITGSRLTQRTAAGSSIHSCPNPDPL